jgi:hypothetical protein
VRQEGNELEPDLSRHGNYQKVMEVLRLIKERIYHLEEEISYQDTQKPDRLRVEGLLRDETGTKNTYSVHIGELVQCAWITQTTPFPWSPRMPREYEIFRFDSFGHAKEFRKTYLGTFVGPAHGARMMGSKEPQSQSTALARARDMADPGSDSIPENTLANFQTRDYRHQNSISIQANAEKLEREGKRDRTENDLAVERAESIRLMPQSGDSHDEDGPQFLPKRRKRSILSTALQTSGHTQDCGGIPIAVFSMTRIACTRSSQSLTMFSPNVYLPTQIGQTPCGPTAAQV